MRALASLVGAAVGLTLSIGGALAADPPALAIPAAMDPPTVLSPAKEGRRLWLKLNCYGCHGMHAAGGTTMGPNVQGYGGGDLNAALYGDAAEHGMPNFSAYITSADVNNLDAYLHVAGTKAEPTFLHWWERNPSK